MKKGTKDGLLAAFVFAIFSILFGYFIYGEIEWPIVIGLTIGGFISWYFIFPIIEKRGRREKS
ncbi:hypothetical protein [Halobacillus litoralis]|uniref:hypothetical protein n=1 Tax=Halobacillus litoralis TaxID=45668 RepID=UPI00136B5FDF|nr:hypothetical protein [Halobacillus litoralis]MCA1020576.1 hypothetical protein [Halobacillus litoralis]MYL36906.1 hypothetical protein [Halobacillus litoralis]